jgi:membrane-bound lytic murein transglycosylase MltF
MAISALTEEKGSPESRAADDCRPAASGNAHCAPASQCGVVFSYGGEQIGFEYELAQAFVKELGVDLEVLTPPPGVELTTWFRSGKGDVIAGLAIPDDYRSETLKVSLPYLDTTAQVLTSSENLGQRDSVEIAGKSLAVQPDAPYARQLLMVTDGAWSPANAPTRMG